MTGPAELSGGDIVAPEIGNSSRAILALRYNLKVKCVTPPEQGCNSWRLLFV